jgi:hypothetical protein
VPPERDPQRADHPGLVVSPLTISLSPILPLLPLLPLPRARHVEFKATVLPIVSQNHRVLDSELILCQRADQLHARAGGSKSPATSTHTARAPAPTCNASTGPRSVMTAGSHLGNRSVSAATRSEAPSGFAT